MDNNWWFTPAGVSLFTLGVQVGDLGTINIDAGLMLARRRWRFGAWSGWELQEVGVIRRRLALRHAGRGLWRCLHGQLREHEVPGYFPALRMRAHLSRAASVYAFRNISGAVPVSVVVDGYATHGCGMDWVLWTVLLDRMDQCCDACWLFLGVPDAYVGVAISGVVVVRRG